MREYSWSGHDSVSGNRVTGTLQATSPQEAIAALKVQKIVAVDVREVGSDAGGIAGLRRFGQKFWGFLFFAFACLAGAAIFLLMTPVNVIRCSPDRVCSIERRIAGIYVLWSDERPDVRSVEIESSTEPNTIRSRPNSPKKYLSLDGMTTDPMTTPIPSCEHIQRDLADFLAAPKGRTFVAAQAELTALVPLILVLAAVHFCRLAFRSTR